MTTPPLDQPARVSRLHEWKQQGQIDDASFAPLLERLRSVQVWRQWAAVCFLVLGVTLLICGIVFFFAWNWKDMPRWERLGLAGGAVLLPALASRLLGAERLAGKMSLLVASMMIGVFLAVFGQEYQTGADTHGLFVGWACLALPWVLCATFEPLWALWLVIVSTGLTLYWKDVLSFPPTPWPWPYLLVSVAALHTLALMAKEALAACGWPWLQRRWSRLWLLFIALAPLTFLACLTVVNFKDGEDRGAVMVGAFAWLLGAGGSFMVYRYRIKDPAAMSLAVGSAGIVVVVGAVRWLWEIMTGRMGDSAVILGGLFLNTAVIGGLIAAWVWLLRRLAMQMAAEMTTPPPLERAPTMVDKDAPTTWRQALECIAPESRASIEQQINALAAKPHEPAWLKVVSAVGGWVAAWTFLPMLFIVIGVVSKNDSGGALMVSGSIFLAISVGLSRLLPATTFLQQMNLALAVGSFSLINVGYMQVSLTDSWGTFTLMQCILAAVTYALFKNGPYRFLVSVWSVASVVIWVSMNSRERGHVFEGVGADIPQLIVLLTFITTVLWTWRSRPEVINPLAYAMAFSLAGTVFFFALVLNMGWLHLGGSTQLGAAGLAVALIALVAALNRGLQSLTSPWLIGLALIVLPLAWTGEMGVLTAMLLTAAAFAWGDKLLGVFAWLFLAGFLFFFYYQMSVPLSLKAAIIGGSGLAFLVIRTVLLQLHQHPTRS